jgi:hypothetical protein
VPAINQAKSCDGFSLCALRTNLRQRPLTPQNLSKVQKRARCGRLALCNTREQFFVSRSLMSQFFAYAYSWKYTNHLHYLLFNIHSALAKQFRFYRPGL